MTVVTFCAQRMAIGVAAGEANFGSSHLSSVSASRLISCVARRTGAVKSMRALCDFVTTACAACHQPCRTKLSTTSNGNCRSSGG
eukprot:CAMPEP_0176134696 /NCGR_PEP_ID=MMETSP0120_2-20121206/68312_1 /TAXON_ID=160619 /ORGANISM="Kryptoperidinium foliaceum, Strain CCMP 1326" /LENGTH=84 /DNA_ID=CAMNT_0017470357 /DNA_START=7 /DNA_END=258 /DNA_ORIENTATION=-